MAKNRTIFSVFIASPSDVEDERNRVESAIRELNLAWATDRNVQLEPVRWETHVHPSVGDDAQDVVNRQLSMDYDLFVGIIWYRLGTPTSRADSGTVEEFEAALERRRRNSQSVDLMLYFKTAPVPFAPHEIDIEQVSRVAQFRQRASDQGVFYREFATGDEFERLMRLNLTQFINERTATHIGATESPPDDAELEEVEDEPGLLDLIETAETEFAAMIEITERFSKATVEMGTRIEKRTQELTSALSNPASADRSLVTSLVNTAANDMERFALTLKNDLPLFDHHLAAAIAATTQAAIVSGDFRYDEADRSHLSQNITAIDFLVGSLESVDARMSSMKSTIETLPRLTTKFNHAKRNSASSISILVASIRKSITLSADARRAFASLLESE